MTAEDQATYGRARSICEFMANVASVMESSGGLNQSLKRPHRGVRQADPRGP
jgi:hypothetical protein